MRLRKEGKTYYDADASKRIARILPSQDIEVFSSIDGSPMCVVEGTAAFLVEAGLDALCGQPDAEPDPVGQAKQITAVYANLNAMLNRIDPLTERLDRLERIVQTKVNEDLFVLLNSRVCALEAKPDPSVKVVPRELWMVRNEAIREWVAADGDDCRTPKAVFFSEEQAKQQIQSWGFIPGGHYMPVRVYPR